jgi:phosphate transport system substrate-binding protein
MRKSLATLLVAAVLIASMIAYEYQLSRSEVLEGSIIVSGAFALYPMMVMWAGEFQKIHPNVRIDVSAGGAGKGMADALGGLVDIGMVSRSISPAEIQKGAFYVVVAKAGAVVTINANNPALADLLAKGVTKSTFMGIFIFGNVTTWGQVVGRPSLTDPINVYTRSDSAGVADAWASYLGNHIQADLKGVGVNGDPGLVQAVQNDRLSIGFNNLNFAYDNKTGKPVEGISIIPLDLNGNGKIDANEDFYASKDKMVGAVASGAYPEPPTMELYLVTKGNFTGLTKDFVKWILTDGQRFELENGYVPLSSATATDQLNKIGQ